MKIIVEEYQENVSISAWTNKTRDVSSFKIIGVSDSGKKVLLDDIGYRHSDGSKLGRFETKKEALDRVYKYKEFLDREVYVEHKIFKASIEKKFVEVEE